MPLVKIEKAHNQTCRLLVRDLTPVLQIQQIHRWKKTYKARLARFVATD